MTVIHWSEHLRMLAADRDAWVVKADEYRILSKYHMQEMALRNAEHYDRLLSKAIRDQFDDGGDAA